MIKTFIKNSGIYLAANGITKVIALVFFAYVARVLTVPQMGTYGLLNSAVTVLGLAMTLQIQQGYTRYYLDTEPERRRGFEYSTVNALFLVNLLLWFVLFFARPLFERAVVPTGPGLYAIVLSMPFTMAINNLFSSKLRLENRAWTAAAQMVVLLLIYVGSTLLLFRLPIDPVFAIYGGLALQNLAALVWYLADLRTWKFTIRWQAIRRSVVFSALIVPAAFGAYMSILTGKYLVNALLDLESVGIYEACSRVATIIQTIMQPLLQATSPIVYGHYRDESFTPRFYQLLHIHLVVVLTLVIGFSLFTSEIVRLVVGPQYLPYSYLVFPFTIAAVLMHLTDFFVNNVHLSQKTQYITVVELVAGTASAAVTYLLIRSYGFTGAIVALVFSYVLRCLMYVCFANGLFPRFKISYALTAGYLLLCGALLVAHYFARSWPLPARALLAGVECTILLAGFMRYYRVSPRHVLRLLRPD